MKQADSAKLLERLEAIQKERALTDAKLADAISDVLKAVGRPDCAYAAHETVLATLHPETAPPLPAPEAAPPAEDG